jgi:FKBP-type peptidyl-prolyl cis-trans isomerases 1
MDSLEKYQIKVVKEGDGKNFPKKGQTVICHYVGTVRIFSLPAFQIFR